jgi:hypothetical protein
MGEKPCIDLKNTTDNGSWDQRIADVGCQKINLWEFSDVLNPLGVTVINEPLEPFWREKARAAA